MVTSGEVKMKWGGDKKFFNSNCNVVFLRKSERKCVNLKYVKTC